MKLTSKFSKQLINEAYKQEKDGRVKQRLLIILKSFGDKSSYQVAEEVNTSHTKVQRWVKRFNRKGVEGLKDKERKGRPAKLSKKQIKSLEIKLDRKSEMRAGYNTIEILHFIKQEFHISYTQRHVRRLLYSIGYSRITPRPSHINKDPIKNKEIVGNLKKNYSIWKKIG
jgi:transposase